MSPRTAYPGSATAAFAVTLVLALLPPSLPAQAGTGTAIKDLFSAYEYYEDDPQTRDGLATVLALTPAELEFVRLKMRNEARSGFVLLARKDDAHWIGLESSRGVQLLRVRDATNEYNGRVSVDMVSGRLTVLRGVDYRSLNRTEDAALTASLAEGYLRRAMSGADPFPAALRMPPADLAILGSPSVATSAVPLAPRELSTPGPGTPDPDDRGYLRLWSTPAIAARELFGADTFGRDSVLESADFTQAHLVYADAEGRHELSGRDLELQILGRTRLPENPLRLEELEGMLANLASRVGGLDLAIDSMHTTFYVPSRPPTAATAEEPSGARDPALDVFERLQALSLLSGDYTVVPESVMDAPGLTQADIDLYWWARMQRAGSTAALYPPIIDSGGKLPWGEFALFATVGLRRAGVPSHILLVRRPGKNAVPYHAICVYQVGESWRWMDAGRFGDTRAEAWERLPAVVWAQEVVYRVVDVAKEWLDRTVDESAGWLQSRIGG